MLNDAPALALPHERVNRRSHGLITFLDGRTTAAGRHRDATACQDTEGDRHADGHPGHDRSKTHLSPARALGIDGRSQMSKSELVDAPRHR